MKLNIPELYEKHEKEFLTFDKVENKTSRRADLHAFNLLDRLVPSDCDMVCSAEHDEIWLEVTPDQLAEVATEEQFIELLRCGVRYDRSLDSFAMFV